MFSDSFACYFFKHFPQWRGRLSLSQQEQLKTFAQEMTMMQEAADIWKCLESNLFLLHCFSHQVQTITTVSHRKLTPEKMVICWTFSLFLCLIVMLLLREKTSPEISNGLAILLGIFGVCLKNSCQLIGKKIDHTNASD